MADHVAAQITIGGCIPRRLVPRLCKVIRAEGLALEWGEAPLAAQSAEELLAARRLVDGELVLQLCDDQARYGEFDALEAFLVKHRIPFDRHSEGHYEFAPCLVVYRPQQGPQQWLATHAGQPAIPVAPLWDLVDELQSLAQRLKRGPRRAVECQWHETLKRLREVLPSRPTPLPAFEIGKSVGLRKTG